MKTIYKYSLKHNINLPLQAKILHVGTDGEGHPCLWALVDTKAKTETLPVYIVRTGGALHEQDSYLGTFVQDGYVWHIFTRAKLPQHEPPPEKDYAHIADLLSEVRQKHYSKDVDHAIAMVAWRLSQRFKQDNLKFDADQFLTAALGSIHRDGQNYPDGITH